MADDLRAAIEAECRGMADAPGHRDRIRAILAAHPVQGEVTFETNLLDPVWLTTSSGRCTTRPDVPGPVQVTATEVGEALRQTAEIETAWRYECQVPMPRLWVRRFLAELGIVVTDRPEVTP